MLRSKALSKKVIVLGVDGMDPRFTKFLLEQGKMPNVQKIIDRGCCREDLKLLGGVPTITPPMWTTLATGAYPMTHGITDFNIGMPGELDLNFSGIFSKFCKAEQLWNVTAEAGKKTVVWHWPGSAWPPSSKSPNLTVVDSTSPGALGMRYASIDSDELAVASVNTTKTTFLPFRSATSNVPDDPDKVPTIVSIYSGLVPPAPHQDYFDEVWEKYAEGLAFEDFAPSKASDMRTNFLIDASQMDGLTEAPIGLSYSPITEPSGWKACPEGAKEFTILFFYGKISRPCLLLKNAKGKYDRVAIYKSKEEVEAIKILDNDVFTPNLFDTIELQHKTLSIFRNARVLELAEDGSRVKIWFSNGFDYVNDSVWYPKDLYKRIKEHVGLPVPTSMCSGQDPVFITKCNHAQWTLAAKWQADCLKYMMDNEGTEVIFSHYHGPDLEGHGYMKHLKKRDFSVLEESEVMKFAENTYKLTDDYLGEFIPYLDKGWSIIILSDHALICPEERPHHIGDNYGVNAGVLKKLGYTVLKKDENGKEMSAVDWEHTTAIQQRSNSIYINLKGRDRFGIVDPKDKYELEEKIITDLYNYKDLKTGHRVVTLALHNKDAVLLGLGGPDSADIIFFVHDDYNYDHGESLSTAEGYAHTSTSPIFIAAGDGIKKGEYTERYIREVDVAPTVSVLLGVDIPKNCEGAPAYQIFSEKL